MKKHLLLTLMLMVCCLGFAKEVKTVRLTTEPKMVCNNCENKIKKTIRFEKGVQDIATDLEGQVITVTYDAEKTSEDKIVKAFDKMKYKATVLCEDCKKAEGEACKKAEGQCCKKAEGEACKKAEGQCCKKAEGEACKKAEVQRCKKEQK